MQAHCLFCKIAQKKIPSQIVFENNSIMAFKDISPQAPVHILVIPKKHMESLNDASNADSMLLGEMQNVIKDIARKENLHANGYRVVVNCGKDAGQEVSHLHFHLLGGRKFNWPPG